MPGLQRSSFLTSHVISLMMVLMTICVGFCELSSAEPAMATCQTNQLFQIGHQLRQSPWLMHRPWDRIKDDRLKGFNAESTDCLCKGICWSKSINIKLSVAKTTNSCLCLKALVPGTHREWSGFVTCALRHASLEWLCLPPQWVTQTIILLRLKI